MDKKFDQIVSTPSENFNFPLAGKLSEANRWIRLAHLIPWSKLARKYAPSSVSQDKHSLASFRLALGTLIIQEKLDISDQETVNQIKSNPYLQYFLGLEIKDQHISLDVKNLVKFREQIDQILVKKIKQELEKINLFKLQQKNKLIFNPHGQPNLIKNRYDLISLKQARQNNEKIIETLHHTLQLNEVNSNKTTELILVNKSINQQGKNIHTNLQYLLKKLLSIDNLLKHGSSTFYLEIASKVLENQDSFATLDDLKVAYHQEQNQLRKQFSHSFRWLLRKTGLFITKTPEPFPYLLSLNHHKKLKQKSKHQEILSFTLWTVIGLMLTIQLDWFLERMINLDLYSQNHIVNQAKVKKIELPQMSLQKSDWEGINLSQNQNFIRLGSTEIIDEVKPKDDYSFQLDLTEILKNYKQKNPHFNNPFLEEKLALYQHRLETKGVPDVIIIGSSRAMRGIDSEVLNQGLIKQGYPELNIFNFGINGATVKVVDLILRQLIDQEALPKMVIFADGARAFNNGRVDVTYEMIKKSEGYQHLLGGTFLPLKANNQELQSSEQVRKLDFFAEKETLDQWLNRHIAHFSRAYLQRQEIKMKLKDQFLNLFNFSELNKAFNKQDQAQLLELKEEQTEQVVIPQITPHGIDYDGFLPVNIKFNPHTYYQKYPQVTGNYDGDYQNFNLKGEQHQSLLNLISYLQKHQVKLVFVNQPLTDVYLDPVRSQYEQEFQDYMLKLSQDHLLIFRDFVQQKSWQSAYQFYSDPSHLNRDGAQQVAKELAIDTLINWGDLQEH